METVMLYHGELVDDMTRERLIKVVKQLAGALEAEREIALESELVMLNLLRR